MPKYDSNPRYPMIIYDVKDLGSHWVKEKIVGKTKDGILDDAVVGHVLRFSYTGDLFGPTHDKRPQLLVLGSTSSKMLGKKRVVNKEGVPDRIHGINLRYLTKGKVDSILKFMRDHDHMHLNDPFILVKQLKQYYDIHPPIYRQYLNDSINRITEHYAYVPENIFAPGSEEEDIVEEVRDEIERRTDFVKLTPDDVKFLPKKRGGDKRKSMLSSLAILFGEFMK